MYKENSRRRLIGLQFLQILAVVGVSKDRSHLPARKVSLIAVNMFGTKSILAIVLLAATGVWSEVSPDETCGTAKAGNNKGYTCPSAKKCCSASGYCGATDEYCLTTVGCQDKFSNATSACIKPTDGETISPDGTCGSEGAGQYGYRCPAEGGTCCSIAGYCGNTTDHCLAANGCQSAYGECQ